jgi:hypothetical protein
VEEKKGEIGKGKIEVSLVKLMQDGQKKGRKCGSPFNLCHNKILRDCPFILKLLFSYPWPGYYSSGGGGGLIKRCVPSE